MKRAIVLLATASLVGCEQDPDHKRHLQQQKTFEKAYQAIEKGQKEYIRRLISFDAQQMRQRVEAQRKAGDLSDERARRLKSETIPAIEKAIGAGMFKKTGRYGKTLETYRFEQLQKAAKDLRALAGELEGRRKITIRALLAEIAASQARRRQRQALDAWQSIKNTARELRSKSTRLRMALARAKGAAAVDLTGVISELQKLRKEAEQRVAQRKERAKALAEDIEALEKKVAAAEARRKKKMKLAAKWKTGAYEASGQARYDLYTKAAAAEREAIGIDARVEKWRAELDRLKSKHRVAQVRAEGAKKRLDRIRARIKAVRDRAKQVSARAQSHRDKASNISSKLIKRLQAMDDRWSQEVTRLLTKGVDKIQEQLDVLTRLRDGASGAAKRHANLAIANLHAERGNLQRSLARVRSRYVRTLRTIRESARAGTGESKPTARLAKLTAKRARAIAERVALTDAGAATFEEAAASYSSAAEILRGSAEQAGETLQAAAKRMASAIEAQRDRLTK